MVEQIQKRERCYQVSVASCVGLKMSDLLFYEVKGLCSREIRQNIFVRTKSGDLSAFETRVVAGIREFQRLSRFSRFFQFGTGVSCVS